MIAPSGVETQWLYDAVGNITKTVDAVWQSVEMAYDALNNPIKSIDASGFATTMTYDKLGRLMFEQDYTDEEDAQDDID